MTQLSCKKETKYTISDEYANGFCQQAEEKEPLLAFAIQSVDLEGQLIERDLAIRNVQASLFQVGDIYRDLGALVGSQQTCIDNIESNVEAATEFTTLARKHLNGASARPRRSAASCCGMVPVLILVIIVLLIIIILLA